MSAAPRVCPKCGGRLAAAAADPTRKTCAGCGARFLVPSQAAAVAASAPAAPSRPMNAFAGLDDTPAPARPSAPAPAVARRPPAGMDPRLRLGLLLGGGLAVLLLGLTTAIILPVVFWPRPTPTPVLPLAVVTPPPATILLPTPQTGGEPAPPKSTVNDPPKPTPPPDKPTPPKDVPPPPKDVPPPLQPTPPPAPPDPQPAPNVNPMPAPPMPAAAPPDPIQTAIDKGVAYLKKEVGGGAAANNPGRGFVFGGARGVGNAGLIGLALLESGVPADDPAVAACIDSVRNGGPSCSQTYEMAIALWFLDRVGDPKDEDLIHDLGARLVAGQLEHGKWTYNCPTGAGPGNGVGPGRLPIGNVGFGMGSELTQDQLKELMETLDKYDPSQEIPANKRLAPVCKYVRGKKIEKVGPGGLRQPGGLMVGMSMGDLSLTQFAVLGLWVARKHHVPVDRSLLLAEAYVRANQDADGGWDYNGMGMGTTDSMTCSGLMELAVGRGVASPQGGKNEAADPQFEKGIRYLAELFDRGMAPPKPGDAKQAANLQQEVGKLQPLALALFNLVPQKGQNWAKDLLEFQAELEKSLALDLPPDALGSLKELDEQIKKVREAGAPLKEKVALEKHLQQSVIFQQNGAVLNPFNMNGPGQHRLLKPGKNNRNNMDDIYCLWSVERLCMVCDLKTIAGHDWYAWGADLLVTSQNDDGSWSSAGICPQDIDTCLALLFLKRVNVAKDLTAQLKLIAPIKDLSPDKLKYVSPGETPSPGLTTPSPGETPPSLSDPPKEAPKP